MAKIDQHLAYFDAIVETLNVPYYLKPNSKAKKDVMVVANTAIAAHLSARPFPAMKNILDNHPHLQYAPSKRVEFLLHRMPLLVF